MELSTFNDFYGVSKHTERLRCCNYLNVAIGQFFS